ncbi:MAG: hypothetical protein JNM74_02885 [Myxococcales bacterium]|nr:hypothetical protein [Myxococcales bacterium]
MRVFHVFFPFALGAALPFMACSSTPEPPSADAASSADGAIPEASTADGASPDATPIDGSRPDAADAAPAPGPVSGTLEAKAVAGLPTQAKLGTFVPKEGSAELRPRPSGGSVLTVRLTEDRAIAAFRTIEITLYDDTQTLDATERFQAEASTQTVLPPRRARVETYPATGTSHRAGGDGAVLVEAISATQVTLRLQTVGQFGQGPGQDVFTLDGTVTVPLAKLPDATGGAASLAVSNPENEPITGEAPNFVQASLATSQLSLKDASYPFTNDRRSALFTDTTSGTARTLRVAFPSGHLPREGETVSLSRFDRVNVVYFEGTGISGAAGEKVWEADMGSAVVETRTRTQLVLRLADARMQSESPDAKGIFRLAGTLTIPIAGE